MYLISVYFDEKTECRLKQFITKAAEMSGNNYMLRGKVPPHMTISAFTCENEKEISDSLEVLVKDLKKGTIQLVSVGSFPGVVFLSAVLNEYLHEISGKVYDLLQRKHEIEISELYRPFQWMPHTTIGKKLKKEEIKEVFSLMYSEFQIIEAQIVKIGLAKTNPYHNLKEWELM